MVKPSELSVKKIVTAVGGLVILAGGAYYYFVYLPQLENASAVAAHQAVKSPAGAKSAKPPAVQRPLAASAVPTASDSSTPLPVAAAPAQPVIATTSEVAHIAAAPPLEPTLKVATEPVKPKPAARKTAPKKPRVKKLPAQPAMIDSGPDVAATSPQLTSPLPAVLPETGVANEPAAVTRIDTPKYNDMLTAVLRSDKDAVRKLLDMGRWVDKPGSSGLTPLMAAVMNEDAQMVQLLLEHGAEPSARALKLARKNKDAATVLLLEQHGAR